MNDPIPQKLYQELDAIIDLSRKAQGVTADNVLFMQQISLLFNRIEVMAALKDGAMIDAWWVTQDQDTN